MSEITEGTWAVCQPQGASPFTIYSQNPDGRGNKWICQGPNVGAASLPSVEELKSNMNAIAALPDILEALRNAVEEIEYLRKLANNNGGMIDEEKFIEGRAAIAKALGENALSTADGL